MVCHRLLVYTVFKRGKDENPTGFIDKAVKRLSQRKRNHQRNHKKSGIISIKKDVIPQLLIVLFYESRNGRD